MNPNLHIQLSNPQSEVKLLQYNVDMAVREEKFENTKWMNRKDRVAKLINAIDADIVCLQEMRALDGAISVNQFLSSMDKYHYKVEYRNPGPLSFGNAILYKPNKFYPLQVVKKWLSDTPDQVSDSYVSKDGETPKGFGYIVMGVQFQRVENNKIVTNSAPFWVFNTHLGIDEKLKTQSCHQLVEIIDKVVGFSVDNFILSGDFNFFPDKDGKQQREILVDAGYQDLGKEAITIGGRKVEGTFVGYDHDEFKADLSNMNSRLDHVFASSHVKLLSVPVLDTRTMLEQEPEEELTNRNMPSDHLPLVVSVSFP